MIMMHKKHLPILFYIVVILFFYPFKVYCADQPTRGIIYSDSSDSDNYRGVKPLHDVVTKDGTIRLYDESYALLIGINKYDDWHDLRNPVRDVNAVNELLQEKGFKTTLLTDETEDKPTRENIEKYMKEIHSKKGMKDRILIFYAGHGETKVNPHTGVSSGYIIPKDGKGEDLLSTCILMESIKLIAQNSDANHIIYLFDCCFGGLFVDVVRTGKRPPPEITRRVEKATRLAISAGGAGERASDGDYHSPFCKYFLKAFEDEECDLDKDGYIIGDELAVYLFKNVKHSTDKEQTPTWGKMEGFSEGDFVFEVKPIDKYGTILISTNSFENLTIFIDGIENRYKVNKNKPFSCQLSVGTHTIEIISAQLFFPKKEVLIKENEEEEIYVDAPIGSILVTSNIPEEATVFLDGLMHKWGKVSNTQPITIHNVAVGSHRIKVVGPDTTVFGIVAVEENLTVELKANLIPGEEPEPEVVVEPEPEPEIKPEPEAVVEPEPLPEPIPEPIPEPLPEPVPDSMLVLIDGAIIPPMEFKLIRCDNSFVMGADTTEEGSYVDERPKRFVTLSPFYILTTEVTQFMWECVMGRNPSNFKGNDLPVESVSWRDCQRFLDNLNALDPGKDYRLPTEAEWEYACRAGSAGSFNTGIDLRADDANFNAEEMFAGAPGEIVPLKTTRVKSYPANNFGLYDMHGNVCEWCQDWYGFYSEGRMTDPQGPSEGKWKVHRGGSYLSIAAACRSANRDSEFPYKRKPKIGFRIVKIKK
ncbi:MAG: SUMF1/EgtB/PvdO family nonheme iron enzyme [candidate division Zixibacteria bacterium]|nr:SUMF1/EgtB/PvdO family nonheme iron enzyme [Candidatus Tariuqbacter arcticus]